MMGPGGKHGAGPSRRRLVAGAALAILTPSGVAAQSRRGGSPFDRDLQRGDDIFAILDATPFIRIGAERPGRVLYEVGFRACPGCIQFARRDASLLAGEGLEVRSLTFAPFDTRTRRRPAAGPGELSMLAHLYRTGDAELLHDWFAGPDIEGFARRRGIPLLGAGSKALIPVEVVRRQVRGIGAILDGQFSEDWGFPAFFWRDDRGARCGFGWGEGWLDGPRRMLRG